MEERDKFSVSVLAMGRSEGKRSGRWRAETEGRAAGAGCEAIAPAEDRRESSLKALSLRCNTAGIWLPLPWDVPARLLLLLLSPRLVVKTFKHTLRGGISGSGGGDDFGDGGDGGGDGPR